MIANNAENVFESELYLLVIDNFQNGNWTEGFAQLDHLMESHPYVTELRTLRQDMLLRARIDSYEEEDQRLGKIRLWKNMAVRLIMAILIIGVLYTGYVQLAGWIKEQMVETGETLTLTAAELQMAADYRNAQNLLLSGRPSEAEAIFAAIAEENPGYQEIDYWINRAKADRSLEELYNQALRQLQAGDRDAALATFKSIMAVDSAYKDVALQIAAIEQNDLLDGMFEQASAAYENEDWIAAASGFAAIRSLNTSYLPNQIADRLFESYISAAETLLYDPASDEIDLNLARTFYNEALALRPRDSRAMERYANALNAYEERMFQHYVSLAHATLAENSAALDALQTADGYFLQALALRPNDPQILAERQSASLFIQAQNDFLYNQLDSVIAALEQVLAISPDYAQGAARQTLFEAYLARGDGEMASALYDLAYEDYQRAVILAAQTPDPGLRSYQAQVRLAKVQGALGNFESAVLVYENISHNPEFEAWIRENHPSLVSRLVEAAGYASINNFRTAYRVYSDTFNSIEGGYDIVVHVVTKSDYLTLIAAQYNTTVDAILEANGITHISQITPGQEINVPVMP